MPEIELRQDDETQASRKPYHSPEFREYGSVEDLTQQGPTPLQFADNLVGAPGYINAPST